LFQQGSTTVNGPQFFAVAKRKLSRIFQAEERRVVVVREQLAKAGP
jgi:hypothetical protein